MRTNVYRKWEFQPKIIFIFIFLAEEF